LEVRSRPLIAATKSGERFYSFAPFLLLIDDHFHVFIVH